MNSRNEPTSPIPRSLSLRSANSGTSTPAIRLSGDKFILQPQMNTDETQIQKTRRLYSSFARPKFNNIPTFRPVAFSSFSNCASSRLSYCGATLILQRRSYLQARQHRNHPQQSLCNGPECAFRSLRLPHGEVIRPEERVDRRVLKSRNRVGRELRRQLR